MRRILFSLTHAFIAIVSVHLQSQTWETLADIPEKLTYPMVTVLEGKIYVMGGGGAGGATTSHYRYDPATNKWDTLAPVPYKAQQPAGAANNGRVHYFGGGYPNSGTPLDKHYAYTPSSNTWVALATLTKKRAIGYAVSVNNQLYSLAGQGSETTCQMYNDTTDSWITKGPLPDSKFWYGAHIVANGKIYRFCGGGYTAPVNTVNEYDPQTDVWSTLESFPEAVHGIDGAAVGDRIYLFGGYYNKQESFDAWIYDTKTQQYFLGTPLPAARYYHRVVAIDNNIYCVGGYNSLDANAATSLIRLKVKDAASDVGDLTSTRDVSLSPNPADDYVIASPSSSTSASSSIFRLEITDGLGRIIHRQNMNDVSRVNTSAFPSGMYTVRLLTDQNYVSRPLLIEH